MSEADSVFTTIEHLTQLSSTGALIGILFLFYSRKVVWGWQLDEEKKRRETYESLLNDNSAKTEAKLAAAEQKLDDYERRAKAS